MSVAPHDGLAFRGVSFGYPGVRVLERADLDVRRGEVVGLTGANGAGKTTTFRLAAALLRPWEGAVWTGGHAVGTDARAVKRVTAYVPDEPALHDRLSGQENLNLYGLLWEMRPAAIRERSERLLREVGLWGVRDRFAEAYSRGMRQKLALCCALLHDPSVVLLDEPFSGLDTEGGLWLRAYVRSLAEEGRAIVLSTHTPEVLAATADRVVSLGRGRFVEAIPGGYGAGRDVARRIHGSDS